MDGGCKSGGRGRGLTWRLEEAPGQSASVRILSLCARVEPMITLLLLATASATPLPCATPLMLPDFGPRTEVMPPPPPGADKKERDAGGPYPNELKGDNFIIKWGDGVSDGKASHLLGFFEDAWAAEIEDWGQPAPYGTETYLFNVYIGDTGGGTPEGHGAGGYYTRDGENMPMIVIAKNSLENEEYVAVASAHEFYHALQDASGAAYAYDGDSAWYWEATATWASGEVYPDDAYYGMFLYGYALLPQLSINFFDYPDTGTLQEYHQYGAFIFPRYLSELVADRKLIVDSWIDSGSARDPLEALADELAKEGVDLADAFGDFAARNAWWDYLDGEDYADNYDYYYDYYGDEGLVDEVKGADSHGEVEPPEDSLPERFAYNIIDISTPSGSGMVVDFTGANKGSKGSAADWRITLVQDDRSGPTYFPLTLEEGAGSMTVESTGGDDFRLVVAATPEKTSSGETFSYSYEIRPIEGTGDPEDEEPDDLGPHIADLVVEEAGGCACANRSAPAGSTAWVFGLGFLGLVGRRRRASVQP